MRSRVRLRREGRWRRVRSLERRERAGCCRALGWPGVRLRSSCELGSRATVLKRTGPARWERAPLRASSSRPRKNHSPSPRQVWFAHVEVQEAPVDVSDRSSRSWGEYGAMIRGEAVQVASFPLKSSTSSSKTTLSPCAKKAQAEQRSSSTQQQGNPSGSVQAFQSVQPQTRQD